MKEGPCGDVFVAAYRCFLESKAEERGSDCLDQFQAMQACFVENADCASPPPGSLASNQSQLPHSQSQSQSQSQAL